MIRLHCEVFAKFLIFIILVLLVKITCPWILLEELLEHLLVTAIANLTHHLQYCQQAVIAIQCKHGLLECFDVSVGPVLTVL